MDSLHLFSSIDNVQHVVDYGHKLHSRSFFLCVCLNNTCISFKYSIAILTVQLLNKHTHIFQYDKLKIFYTYIILMLSNTYMYNPLTTFQTIQLAHSLNVNTKTHTKTMTSIHP